jgi:FkbM family methyltransferase
MGRSKLGTIIGVALKGNFKKSMYYTLGYLRYFLNNFPPVYDPYDYSILQLLIVECGLPLDKHLFAYLLDKVPVIIRFTDNSKFIVMCLEDFYHASLCYEPETLAFIRKQLANGEVFVDVGANIGGYTIRAARTARVYVFEPHPRNFHLLMLNVKINELHDNVRAFQAAAGARLGKAKLAVSDYYGRHSLLQSFVRMQSKRSSCIEVNMVTLDSVLTNEDHIDVIKIDVEGAEPLVLEGAKETLKRTEIVIVEASLKSSFYRSTAILAKYSFKPLKKVDSNMIFIKNGSN